jgi:hypothetical protein
MVAKWVGDLFIRLTLRWNVFKMISICNWPFFLFVVVVVRVAVVCLCLSKGLLSRV